MFYENTEHEPSISLFQITAETAYDMVSPAGPSVRRRLNRKGKRKRIHPPQVSLTLQIELIFDD